MLLAPLYYVLFFVTLLLPGYVLIKRLNYFRRSPGIALVLGYCITIVLYAFLATLVYAAKVSPLLTRIITVAIIVAAIYEFVRLRYYKDLWQLRFPLMCVLSLSVFATVFLSLTYSAPFTYFPDPQPLTSSNYHAFDVKVLNISRTQANDNSIPYRQAQFFIHRSDPAKDPFISEWSVTFFVRTPLMGAVTANYFNLLNEKPPVDLIWSKTAADPHNTFLQFQILAHILNSLFLIPAFLLLSRLFNKKTAIITCLFLVVNQYFLYNTFYSWPKSLVAFFVLTAWLLLMEKQRSYAILAGLVFGAAYLTHDLAVLYLGATALYLLIARRFKDLLWVLIIPFFCALSWLAVASRRYGQPSNFIYYPLSTKGIPQPNEHEAIVKQFFNTPLITLLQIRLGNIYYLLSPYSLFTTRLLKTLPDSLWALNLFSITGALGLGLLPAVFLAAIKRVGAWFVWILAFAPVAMESLIIGWPQGLGALHFAEATVVLLAGISISYLSSLKNSWWLLTAFIVNGLGLGLFMLLSYRYGVRAWLHSPVDLLSLAIISCLIGGTGWLVYQEQHNKTARWLHP